MRSGSRYFVVFVVLLCSLLLPSQLLAQSGTVTAPLISNNLVMNPGAEIQPVTRNSWVQVSGSWGTDRQVAASERGLLAEGRLFWAGKAASGELIQDVDLSTVRTLFDRLGVSVVLEASLSGFSGDSDSAQLVLELYDAGKKLVGQAASSMQDYEQWTRVKLSAPLTDQAVTARVRLLSRRDKGEDNNGYFDNISLVLSGPKAPAAAASTPAASTVATQTAVVRPPVVIVPKYGYWFVQDQIISSDAVAGNAPAQSSGSGPQDQLWRDAYVFTGVKGQALSIRLETDKPSQRVDVLLLGPTGTEERAVLDSASPRTIMRLSTTLAENGTYSLFVQQEAWQRGEVAQQRPMVSYRLEYLGSGQEFTGTLDFNSQRDRLGSYFAAVPLELESGYYYTITVTSTDFDTSIQLVTIEGDPWLLANGSKAVDGGGGKGVR